MNTSPMILNLTSTTNFMVDIPDNDYTQGLKLEVQAVTLPGINIPITTIPVNPQLSAHLPGSAIEFDPLILRVAVDEGLTSYLGCYKWMIGTVDYSGFDSIRWLEKQQALSVHVLDNSKSKVVATFHFYYAWPSNLGELELTYTPDSEEMVTCMMTFNFKYMEIEIDGKVITPQSRKAK